MLLRMGLPDVFWGGGTLRCAGCLQMLIAGEKAGREGLKGWMMI